MKVRNDLSGGDFSGNALSVADDRELLSRTNDGSWSYAIPDDTAFSIEYDTRIGNGTGNGWNRASDVGFHRASDGAKPLLVGFEGWSTNKWRIRTADLSNVFLSDAVVPTSGSEWWHIKLDVDLAANSGLGEATLYAEKAGSGTGLQPVAGLTDVNLNLDDDAATWDGLSVDLQWGAGIDNIKIDNIKITAVPEPSSAAVMAGLAGLGLALLRRRR